jgi:hypothetical protein
MGIEQAHVEELRHRLPERCSHLVGAGRAKRCTGRLLGRFLGHGPDHPFDQRERRRRHAQTLVSHAEQQHDAEWLGRHLPADAHRQAGFLAHIDDPLQLPDD